MPFLPPNQQHQSTEGPIQLRDKSQTQHSRGNPVTYVSIFKRDSRNLNLRARRIIVAVLLTVLVQQTSNVSCARQLVRCVK